MCGIAGIIVKSEHSIPDLRLSLQLMQDSMVHRGPDDGGLFVDKNGRVGLANRRLAIRDLSSAGHMPMSNPAQTVWITFNGEIYNSIALKKELESLGYCFNSTSDTEVILLGYEAWGTNIVNCLRGIFAFAIYDLRNDVPQILIARDHMGVKPLYYAETDAAFLFASELKTLRASGMLSCEISSTGLVGYLLTGSVPNPYTIYASIQALQPAHLIALPLTSINMPEPKRYWHLPTDTQNLTGSIDEVIERVRELLIEAVRIQLVSDAPLGAFLSGGLDSSTVVALMRHVSSGVIRTCSMIFDEAEYSESKYACAVAEALGTEHYERVITSQDIINELDNIFYAMDQPSVDGVNTYFVSKTAREAGLTVALSGLGGDELFGGYPNTFSDVPRVLRALKLVHTIPAGTYLAHCLIQMLPQRQRWSRLENALDRPASLASAYLARRGLFSHKEVEQLVTADVWETLDPAFNLVHHVAERADGNLNADHDEFAWISRAELSTYTHHQLLRDTDVMSMIHSLEVRVPLLDKCLVEAVLRLPRLTKRSADNLPKPLLVRSIEDRLPALITERREKRGFTFPFDSWLRGPLLERTTALFEEVGKSGMIQPVVANQVLQDFLSKKLHWSRVWAIVALMGGQ